MFLPQLSISDFVGIWNQSGQGHFLDISVLVVAHHKSLLVGLSQFENQITNWFLLIGLSQE